MQKTLRGMAYACLALLVGTLGACGGGGSDSGNSGGDCPDPAFTDLTGVWAVENQISGDCQNELERFEVFIDQSDAELKFLGRTSFTATLCGSRASADRPVSYVRNGGVMTVNNLVLTFPNNTTFSGTAQWTWTMGSSECSGSMSISGLR